MRCLGRTTKFNRCKIENRKWYYPFCNNHSWQPILLIFITIPAVIGTYAGIYRDILEPIIIVSDERQTKVFEEVTTTYEAVEYLDFFPDCQSGIFENYDDLSIERKLCNVFWEIRKNILTAKKLRLCIYNNRVKFDKKALFRNYHLKNFLDGHKLIDKAYVVEAKGIYEIIDLYLSQSKIINNITSKKSLVKWNDSSKTTVDDIIFLLGILDYYLIVEIPDDFLQEVNEKELRFSLNIAFDPYQVNDEIKLRYFDGFQEDIRGEGAYAYSSFVWR